MRGFLPFAFVVVIGVIFVGAIIDDPDARRACLERHLAAVCNHMLGA